MECTRVPSEPAALAGIVPQARLPVPVQGEERGMPLDHLAAHMAGQERCDAEARFGELLPAYHDLASNIGLP
jgi:hypothetical protein